MPVALDDLPARLRAADLAESSDELDALAAVTELTGETDGGLERHGVRCYLLCLELAAIHSAEVDRELLLIAALLHDIGLYPGASRGGVYVKDGAEFARGVYEGRPGWERSRLETLLLTIERHHELRRQWQAGPEVELMRRADLIEVSATAVRFAVPRERIRAINAAVPRKGFYREIGRLLGRAALERPTTLPRIFIRR